MELSRVNVIVRTNLKHFKVGKKKILKKQGTSYWGKRLFTSIDTLENQYTKIVIAK